MPLEKRTYTLPPEMLVQFEREVPSGKRSALIAALIREWLDRSGSLPGSFPYESDLPLCVDSGGVPAPWSDPGSQPRTAAGDVPGTVDGWFELHRRTATSPSTPRSGGSRSEVAGS